MSRGRWGAREAAACWEALVDLVVPTTCAGCGVAGGGQLCQPCREALDVRPARTTPVPSPPGLPATTALAGYAGALRAMILGYKERGRHSLGAVLGDRLAEVVVAAVRGRAVPVLLLPVPCTAEAARRRRGDHMLRLANRCARAMRRRGWSVAVASPLVARPRADSSELSARARAVAAGSAFTLRRREAIAVGAALRAGAVPVLLDDVITTGATLAAAAVTLRTGGVDVRHAAVLAATRRRSVSGGRCTPSGADDHPAGGDLRNLA